MNLETKRLILRHPRVQDAEDYTAIHNSEFVLRFNAMAPTTAERMASQFANQEYVENTVFLEEKASGKLIGAIFLEDDDLRYGVESKGVSYFLSETYCRQGFMKEAMGAVIRYLFQEEKLECISARAFAPNMASRGLLRSLGFQENGIIPRCVKGYGNVVFDDVIHTLFRNSLK